MTILDKLTSGDIHAAIRAKRPDCVDVRGNIHRTPERRAFVDWRIEMAETHGQDVSAWPQAVRDEFDARYVK